MAKTDSVQRKKRVRGVSKSNLMIALLSAADQASRMTTLERLAPSKPILRKTADALRANEKICEDLETYAIRNGYTAFARRGRFAPQAGDTRIYNVQKIKEDVTFIRLPLSSLSVDKGAKVRVDFEAGAIVVRAADRAAAAH